MLLSHADHNNIPHTRQNVQGAISVKIQSFSPVVIFANLKCTNNRSF